MYDPVTWILRALMIAVTAINLYSCVRCWYLGNKYDLRRTINACMRDQKGEISFAEWMLIHHHNEPVELTDLLRLYKRWRDERDLPITTRLVNDGILIDMLINGLDNTEDTPT